MLNAGAYQSANPLITSTNSMYFSGPDEYLQLSEPFNYTNHTVTGWIKSSQDTGVGVIFDGRDGTNDNVAIYLNNGVLYYNLGGFATNSVPSIATGKWVNITCSYDGATAKIYLDGVLANSVSGVGTISSTKNAVIGVNFLDFQEYVGNATEIGTYNRTLTDLEVASLYNQGMPTNLLVNRNDYQSGNPTVFNTKQVDFDGVDDFMQISPLGLTGTFTYSFWYKGDGNPDFLAGDSATDTKIGFVNSKYFIRLSVDGDNTIALGTLDWNHLVVTRDSANKVDIYVNGGSANRLFSDAAQASTVNLDYIGKTNSGQNYDGQLSQAGVWNSTLTADEVSSLYNHGLPVDLNTNQAAYESSSNLVGYWRMGSGTLDSYPLIADQTNATLGSELVVNGDFATDSDWTKQTGWTISGGKANALNSSGSSFYQASSLISGKSYKVSFDITNLSSGSVAYRVNSTEDYIAENGTHTITWLYDGSFNYIYFLGDNFTGSIDNVSVKQVQGNPATMTNMVEGNITNQYPLTKIRNYYRMGDGILDKFPCIQDQTSPNLAHIPTTNLFAHSNDFSVWSVTNLTISPNEIISPDGTLNGAKITDNSTDSAHRMIYGFTTPSSGTFTYSLFLKKGTLTTAQIQVFNDGTASSANINLLNGTITDGGQGRDWKIENYGNDWYRCSISGDLSLTSTTIYVYAKQKPDYIGNGDYLYVWGVQLEVQSQATAYLPSYGIASVRKATTTNLITYSEDLSQSIWNKTRVTIVTNSNIAPDGTNTANSQLETTDNNSHFIYTNYTTTDNSYIVSAYLKYNNRQWVQYTKGGAASGYVNFDILNGVVGNFGGAYSNPKMENVGNGWYRCSVTLDADAESMNFGFCNILTNVTSRFENFVGDVTKGFYIWGVQFEEQTQVETYAPTFGLPVTIDLFTENNYGTMINMTASDIVPDTPNN
jgi:hypothetical protein